MIDKLGITETQWPYYRHWLVALIIAEGLMVLLNDRLFEIYLVIGVLFLGGFLLRVLKRYPGQDEPLILDFSAFVFAVGLAYLAQWLGESNWRFLQIFCSSIIIIPHFVFIALEK